MTIASVIPATIPIAGQPTEDATKRTATDPDDDPLINGATDAKVADR
jgi:hypothetical protein